MHRLAAELGLMPSVRSRVETVSRTFDGDVPYSVENAKAGVAG